MIVNSKKAPPAKAELLEENKRLLARLTEAEKALAAHEREATIEFLRLVNESLTLQDLIAKAVSFFQQQTGCEAVGIRLQAGEDFPYFQSAGFPQCFLLTENTLCARDRTGKIIRDDQGLPVLECMCGQVIRGRYDPANPYFTANGSFWANSTTELLAQNPVAERRQPRVRHRCHGEGYESVALIPLWAGEKRLGLIQLNDRRPGMFSGKNIDLWERLFGSLAVAILKLQAEETLRESEERYRLLFDRNPDGVFVVDASGRFQVVNPACEVISGYTMEELLGMTFMQLCAPDQLDNTVEHFERTLRHLTRPQFETTVIRKDGRRAEVWVVGEPIITEGNTLSVHCTAKDITERKQEEDARQFLMRCGATSGEDFFQELARYLAQSLAMDFVCIDRLEEGLLSARTTEAVYFDGKFEDNVTYTLHDTPCGEVVASTVCCFPEGVRQLYPNDTVLQDMRAESYVGITLLSSQRYPIGLIAVIGRQPLANPHLAQSILQLTAVRAAGELERRKAEEALRDSEMRLRQSNSELEFWVGRRTIELQRTNQALRMLSACNEAVIRMDDEQTLMQEICRIAVEIGGYRMAWVGMAEDDAEMSVRPVALAGFEEGYLEVSRISWGDNERGRGPTGMAIRTGEMQISQDFRSDPRLAPWREEAIRRGYRRSIVVPLRQDEAVIGALNIYSSEPTAFSSTHIKVLNDLTEDLEFGLTALRMRSAVRESRDRLRALAGELTLAEQRERRRLANFLHDHLQQLLVGAKFRTVMLGRTGDATTKQRAKEVEDLLDETITASRSLTAELNPPIMQKGGLSMGLQWLARWMADKHGLCVELNTEPEELPLDEDVKVLVFESVRELLFNVVKHAQTQSATVTMQVERGGGRMRIVVADNGVGYDPDLAVPVTSGSGFGLFSIRERLDLIGGGMEIISSPGNGCRCTITTPLGTGSTLAGFESS